MNSYNIADLTVNMEINNQMAISRAEKYKISFTEDADFSINISERTLLNRQAENPHLSIDECEYIWTGKEFYKSIIDFDGMLLHSSCVYLDGQAYLFSASSGIGKSTHTGLWQQYFGDDRAKILNDDKPAIRLIDDTFYAFGTPFSGKSDLNENSKVKVKAIIFLERANENKAVRLKPNEVILDMLNQTLRPMNSEKYQKLLSLMDKLITKIPIYKLYCNISEDAVKLIYNTIRDDI